jgi:hypothetical protein
MIPRMETITLKTVRDCLYDTLFLPENMPHEKAYLFVNPVGQYAGRKIKGPDHTNILKGDHLIPENVSIEFASKR